jgi:hypothetical protein
VAVVIYDDDLHQLREVVLLGVGGDALQEVGEPEVLVGGVLVVGGKDDAQVEGGPARRGACL